MNEVQTTPHEVAKGETKESTAVAESPVRKQKGKAAKITLLSLVVGTASWIGIANARLNSSVQSALRSDARNAGIVLKAHYANYINFNTLNLDLDSANGKAPIELLRAMFQAAEAMKKRGSTFGEVHFSHRGRVAYTMDGSEFRSLGASFRNGENPLYLVRTLPEKIRRPSGEPAFERGEGGILGVFQRQMTDATTFARTWAGE